jgi:hypothetical protein
MENPPKKWEQKKGRPNGSEALGEKKKGTLKRPLSPYAEYAIV